SAIPSVLLDGGSAPQKHPQLVNTALKIDVDPAQVRFHHYPWRLKRFVLIHVDEFFSRKLSQKAVDNRANVLKATRGHTKPYVFFSLHSLQRTADQGSCLLVVAETMYDTAYAGNDEVGELSLHIHQPLRKQIRLAD